MCLSRDRSATNRLSFAFSSRSCLSSRISVLPRLAYFFFQMMGWAAPASSAVIAAPSLGGHCDGFQSGGIDLAKNVFQLHRVDELGEVVLRRRVQRAQLLETVAQLAPSVIGVEASSSAYHWAERSNGSAIRSGSSALST